MKVLDIAKLIKCEFLVVNSMHKRLCKIDFLKVTFVYNIPSKGGYFSLDVIEILNGDEYIEVVVNV